MPDQLTLLIFQLAVLLFSVMVHEVSHGAVALSMGDTTAKDAGRLTLNPLKHLDFFGSFLVPLSLFLFSGGNFILGWAKPVPYNPFRLKNPKAGAGLIGVAGPASNIILALIFAGIMRFISPFATSVPEIFSMLSLFNFVVFINILLAVFNMLPIPPLDGSNVLFALLPSKLGQIQDFLTRYGFFFLILFIFFGFQYIIPLVLSIHRLLVGNVTLF